MFWTTSKPKALPKMPRTPAEIIKGVKGSISELKDAAALASGKADGYQAEARRLDEMAMATRAQSDAAKSLADKLEKAVA